VEAPTKFELKADSDQFDAGTCRVGKIVCCAREWWARRVTILPTRMERGRALAHPTIDSMSSEFAIAVNLKTAKALGLEVPWLLQ
jgi:hypothetical protein